MIVSPVDQAVITRALIAAADEMGEKEEKTKADETESESKHCL